MSNSLDRLLSSSLLMLAVRLFQRSLGLVSIVILARVLVPEAFGVVATASLIVAFFNVLALSGGEEYIIQKRDADDVDLNTAWSIDLTLKLSLFTILTVALQFADGQFDNPDVIPCATALGLMLVFQGLTNPGVILLRKELTYAAIVRVESISKVCSFFVTIALALIYESPWALILGTVLSSAIECAGSYLIHAHRPRYTLARVKTQFAFSQWVFLRGVLHYASNQIDSLIVARMLGTEALGRYYLPRDIVLLPHTEIINPLVRPLLASFSDLKQNLKYLANQMRVSMVVVLIAVFPIFTFFLFFSETIVLAILGDAWVESIPVLQNLSFVLLASAPTPVLTSACVSLARVKFVFFYRVVSVVAIIGTLLIVRPTDIETLSLVIGPLRLLLAVALALLVWRIIRYNLGRVVMLVLPFGAGTLGIGLLASAIPSTGIHVADLAVAGCVHFAGAAVLILGGLMLLRRVAEEYDYVWTVTLKMAEKLGASKLPGWPWGAR